MLVGKFVKVFFKDEDGCVVLRRWLCRLELKQQALPQVPGANARGIEFLDYLEH